MPTEFRAEGILEGLVVRLTQVTAFYCPRRGKPADSSRTAGQAGAIVEEVVAYETVLGPADAGSYRLARKQLHAVTFTSSSTVRNFVTLLQADQRKIRCPCWNR